MRRASSGIDWLSTVDLDRASANVDIDVRGDWYRDPWDWPEPKWALKRDRNVFVERLNATGVRGSVPIEVPKANFGTRPATVMDPIDRVIYQALADRLSVDLIGEQPSWAYGWRLPPDDPKAGLYARNDYQWDNFTSQLNSLAGSFGVALKSDVVSFFASIDLNTVADMIYSRAGGGMPQDRLLALLDGWSRIPGRSGLPQRSFASAVIANAYVQPVDDLLAHHGAVTGWWKLFAPTGAACRWMDDIWLFGHDAGRLRQAQVDLQRTLREIGLNINLAKTDVLEGEDLMREARHIEHSAVDNGLLEEPKDTRPLGELVDRLLERPEHASRTSLRFVTTRMRWHAEYDRVGDLIENAHRMPHGADHLARLFRTSEVWRDLADWYLEYSTGQWSMLQWSVAQLGTMFPSAEPNDAVRDHLAEVLGTGTSSLPLAALAGERLASWAPDTARVAIREAARDASHPQLRRVLALAGLAAGEERRFIRRLLGEFEENAVTLQMLENTNFRALRVAADFDQ